MEKPAPSPRELSAELVDLLAKSPALKSGTNISVGTLEKTVILNGHVTTPAQKALALKLIKQKAPGYRVIDRLNIHPSKSASPKR